MHLTFKQLLIIGLVASSLLIMSYGYGPASVGYACSGAPFNTWACSSCHYGGTFTPTLSIQLLDSNNNSVSTYQAGHHYTLNINLSSTTGPTPYYGFQVTCADSSTNNNINTWGTLPIGTHSATVSYHTYIEHASVLSSGIISIPWTAPQAGTGTVIFYCAGNIVNNNGQASGDNPTSNSITIPEFQSCNLSVQSTIQNINCFGTDSGAIQISIQGNSSSTTYQWYGPNAFYATTNNISNLYAGVYQLIITSGNCIDTTYDTVSQSNVTVPSADSINTFNISSLSYSFNAVQPQNTTQFTWLFGDGSSLTDTTSSAINHTYSNAGTYLVTLILKNSCGADTLTKTIQINPLLINNSLISNTESILLYPNPVHKEQLVRINGAIFKNISIYDLFGRQIHNVNVTIQNNSALLNFEITGTFIIECSLTDGSKKSLPIVVY